MVPAKIIQILLLGCCVGLLLSGCEPGRSDQVDEEKEPQFLIGRNLVNAMNYSGAINAFKRALELNPHSAAANLELGWLYAEKQVDEAAAIHFYQEYLRLRPQAGNAEMIRQHIARLKQELARTAVPIPPSSALQQRLEKLAAENRRLQSEVEQLRQAAAQTSPQTYSTPVTTSPIQSPQRAATLQPTPLPRRTSAPSATTTGAAATGYHRVKSGETLTSISRQYGISVEVLARANPGLDPRRIQVGQTVVVPRR